MSDQDASNKITLDICERARSCSKMKTREIPGTYLYLSQIELDLVLKICIFQLLFEIKKHKVESTLMPFRSLVFSFFFLGDGVYKIKIMVMYRSKTFYLVIYFLMHKLTQNELPMLKS